jgi:drug/metabolite transporter (DMT)-like permease
MPPWILWGVFLTVAGVAYQTTSKSVAAQIPVFLGAAVVGLICFLLRATVLFLQSPSIASLREISFSSSCRLMLLGVFAWAIEFGYLMLYKSQAPLSFSRVMIMSLTGILLLMIGVVYFKEDISRYQAAGIFSVLLGLALLTIK